MGAADSMEGVHMYRSLGRQIATLWVLQPWVSRPHFAGSRFEYTNSIVSTELMIPAAASLSPCALGAGSGSTPSFAAVFAHLRCRGRMRRRSIE